MSVTLIMELYIKFESTYAKSLHLKNDFESSSVSLSFNNLNISCKNKENKWMKILRKKIVVTTIFRDSKISSKKY